MQQVDRRSNETRVGEYARESGSSHRAGLGQTVGLIVALVLASVLGGGCCVMCRDGGLDSAAPPRPARINHLAFFKLKNPADAPALIQDCDEQLAVIPGIVSYYCGTHLDVGRTNIDGDYDVGFFVGFENEDDYRDYVNHPNHIAVVEKWKPRWEWIRVHDVVDDTP